MATSINLLTATASELEAKLANNSVNSRQLVKLYLNQISQYNGYLKAVLAVAPEDLLDNTAAKLDAERAEGRIRGPLHGIPIIVKVPTSCLYYYSFGTFILTLWRIQDHIATVPELGLPTTGGSLALVGSRPRKNADIIERLIAAGAIILGKANLSEWSWYRSDMAAMGWSAVGGQTQSAYVRGGVRKDDSLGGHSNPGGSSTGSAVAVAAGFSPISVGGDTMGSIIMPSDRAALYAMKPTVKIVSQNGIIPITLELDSAGPMAKSALDLANLLDVLVDPSKTTIPTGGYKSAATGSWGDIRIGILEPEKWLFDTKLVKYEEQASEQMLREWKLAYEKLKSVAKVVKPVTMISLDESTDNGRIRIFNAFDTTFKDLFKDYLSGVDNSKIHSLEDLVEFNKEHADQELPPGADNQAALLRALQAKMTDKEYHNIMTSARERCGKGGIDKTLEENEVDVIIGPGDGPMFSIALTAGYPVATVPLGYLDFNGRPFGLQIAAKAHQEALLVQAQSACEATFPKRQPPPLHEIAM
ncbi:amidase family [Trichoderma arundinaceum]|uniref:Amidase family n=1 Tax=Trichoderma arundinaceum TaxID=490622 RepID=A0A395NLE1_TRIAR|nr:amidase family [Trichoderma arundinaceum]